MSSEETVTTTRRPTPLDPYPEARPSEEDGDEKAYPPELGTDAIAVLEGRTFLLSDALGDVPAGSVGGLVHDDTRFLNRWEVTLEGQPLSLLKSRAVDYYSAAFYLTNPEIDGLRPNTLALRRFRFVGNGLLEQLAAVNAGLETTQFELRLACGTDFADLFEMKSAVRDRSERISSEQGSEGRSMRFSYEVPGFRAACTVRVVRSCIFDAASFEELADAPVRIEGDSLVWEVEVPPRQLLGALVRIELELNDAVLEPMHEDFGEQQQA
jgi:N-terminal domain of (some) glycogen debranching enzymes